MAKHKVERVVEIKYTEMTEEEARGIHGLSDLLHEWSCTSFDEGDGFVCLKDPTNPSDDRDYAVYLKSTGGLLCLLSDAGNALEGYKDSEYGMERNVLYKQIALLAGWPESMHDLKVGMTWRQLIVKMLTVPKEFLDTPAYVWNKGAQSLEQVKGIAPWLMNYDGSVPGPKVDDNCYYIDTFTDEE